jgi:hypothetical protein
VKRRLPPPWTVELIPGGLNDASGQSLAYVYGRETRADADTAKVLTMDEARRALPPISPSCRTSLSDRTLRLAPFGEAKANSALPLA